MPSKVPALIDWLVNAFTNAATLGQATPPVTVIDGPSATALDPGLKLWVGLTDPDADTIDSAATITQARGDLGSATRDETSEIHCCAEAWSGVDTIQTVRLQVFGILAAVEALVRADATRFGGNAQAMPGLSVGDLLQNSTPDGAIARIPFSLTFRSLNA